MPGLEASVEADQPLALNDVSLIRRQHGRVAELAYRLGGKEVGHVRCDGLVAATPAGSTGYNLANSGPILAWGVEGYVVSFIAPHTLTARPLVVAPDDVLSVTNAAGRDPVEVVLDGEPVGRAGERRRDGDPLPRRRRSPGAATRARTSTAASATSSGAWLTRPAGVATMEMERKWWTLLAVCVATFMLLLDVTIVNVALPDIQSDLDASFSSLQWVIDAYALTLASFLLVAGSIGDRIGRRRVFSFGFALFTAASFACGLSGDPTVLNLARGVQGTGAAAMFATALALIAQEFEGRERANAIGIWGATVGGAVAVGPLIGGLITEGLGWEWIFFVNVPIGIARDRAHRDQARQRQGDRPAADRLARAWSPSRPALFLLIFGLIRGNAEGWGSAPDRRSRSAAPSLLLLAFVVIELRSARTRCSTCRCSASPSFTGVSIVAFTLSAGMFAMFLYLTLYIQDVLEYSPLQAGLRFLPLDPALVRRRADRRARC